MIKFILYDDKEENLKRTSKIINKIMIDYETEYRIEKFREYNQKLERIITKDNNDAKIYFIDIEVPGVDGMALASKIREHDWNSIIIFLTIHEEFKINALAERLMMLDYICKKNEYEKQITETTKTAIKVLDKNKKILKYKFNSIIYRIPINQILYITKIPLSKKCSINTINNEKYEIAGSISEVKKLLGKEFKQSHKSCLVNVENVKLVDSCNNIIIFKNGQSIDLLSIRMKKEFEEYVLNYNR